MNFESTNPLASLRRDYRQRALLEKDAEADPLLLFARWFSDALSAHAQNLLAEPNAMVLSTVSPEGRPRGRFVLLKQYDFRGLVFFTNYQSTKAEHLEACKSACLTFGWLELERQVVFEGVMEKASLSETEAYFHSRPHGSQLGALASPQSQVVPNREYLEARLAEVERDYPEGTSIPVPPHWGGYRLVPQVIEFWQGRTNRLHDRLQYRLEEGSWKISRLAP